MVPRAGNILRGMLAGLPDVDQDRAAIDKALGFAGIDMTNGHVVVPAISRKWI